MSSVSSQSGQQNPAAPTNMQDNPQQMMDYFKAVIQQLTKSQNTAASPAPQAGSGLPTSMMPSGGSSNLGGAQLNPMQLAGNQINSMQLNPLQAIMSVLTAQNPALTTGQQASPLSNLMPNQPMTGSGGY